MVERRTFCNKAIAVAVSAASVAFSAVADVATDMITSEAVFWFDASTLTAAAGTELDSWADVRGGSYPTFTTYTTIKPQVKEIDTGPLAGKKAVTFFTVGTECDMKFASEQAIKTAFFVTDIDQSKTHTCLEAIPISILREALAVMERRHPICMFTVPSPVRNTGMTA